ncbi:MAG: hypothetical protein E7323_04700 [Clostridiales bacterium]|nr:hypothetical protein [Clostridiales bacterium]
MRKGSLVLALLLLCWSIPALAQEVTETEKLYSLVDISGNTIAQIHGHCETGDEYISGDNHHYRVVAVEKESGMATVESLGEAAMPDISWLDTTESLPVSAVGKRRIALYCTHSDESYIKGDGKESDEERGGIYDIAQLFGEKLEKMGATVELNTETHHPHDAGAYRRSRQTAMALIKTGPNAIFDLHRDGIPDPDEYAVTIGDKPMSKVRLLVGKSNQNKEANLAFAKQIKAVGDKVYPGLIKDIYMGKGTYNQDLAPRSVLLEFGTHTLPKERVQASTGPMAEVAYKALFGGVIGSAGASDAASKKTDASDADQPAVESNEGSGAAVWIILALVVGLGLFAILSAGKGGGIEKWKHSFSEMTGGLIGKKPKNRQ